MGILARQYTTTTDERLMALAANGDETAFATLYDRYQGRVLNYFHRMLWHDRERAEDLLQDLFTKLAQRPGIYDPSRSFSTWLFSVANNMCKNEYRREKVRKDAVPELRYTAPRHEQAEHGKAVDHAHFRERLDAELDRLDPDHKATFVMRYHEELPIKEIAATFGCSEGTVKSRLFYTLKKLAERLKEFGPDTIPYGQTRTLRP